MIDMEPIIEKLLEKYKSKNPATWRNRARKQSHSVGTAMREIAWRLEHDPETVREQAIKFYNNTTKRTEKRLDAIEARRVAQIEKCGKVFDTP